ncbi:putative toxin-antitoxin system toxin component, PIN family [Larkinella ripae]
METRSNLPSFTSLIFDTNVFISTFVFPGFSAKVYDFCSIRFTLFTSEWILDELERKLALPKFRCSAERRATIIPTLRERNELIFPENELPSLYRDPDDNHILQLAQFINADFIITGDAGLLELVNFDGTAILSPREFHDRYIEQ